LVLICAAVRICGPDDVLRVRISNADLGDEAVSRVRGLAQPVASLAGAGQNNIQVTRDGAILTVSLTAAENSLRLTRTGALP